VAALQALPCDRGAGLFTLGTARSRPTVPGSMNYRTQAEFFIKGITSGVIDAAEVIAWSDEVIVSAPKSEDWMVEISSCGPEDRLKVLGLLNTVQGQADQAELAKLLQARGLS
jgi:hypothetical protein